ncbi:peptidoglycan-binding domain-containing protein [Streptomyces longisporus]|uniref:Peptidoglycan-binding protein n=1 Tax=Streptomyces longisporus TaxID=1948 RepID=A0ABP6ASX4_STRLO
MKKVVTIASGVLTTALAVVASGAGAAGANTGAVAGASIGLAASQRAWKPASSNAAVPLAVVNLGLSTKQARGVQCWAHNNDWGYNGPYDGLLGTNSWMALQRYLTFNRYYKGPIDGIVGSGTVTGFQQLLKDWDLYGGPIDGIAGSGTEAAFSKWADEMWEGDCSS